MEYKTEIEVDLDDEDDFDPPLVIAGPTCGFCERTLPDATTLLEHALNEHDIKPDVFHGVDLDDPAAVQEAFLRAANLRQEFVSLGEVERCPECGFLSTSAAVLASHKCSVSDPLKSPHKDPFSIVKPRDPLLVPQHAKKVENTGVLLSKNATINHVLNAAAIPILVCKIIKPLRKPTIKLTVGNVIEMSLVDIISKAGMSVKPPEDYCQEAAMDEIYRLCLVPQTKMAEKIHSMSPTKCRHLLTLLRARRIRVPVSDTMSLSNLLQYSAGSSNLRKILPAPTPDGLHLTLMETLLDEARVHSAQQQSVKVQAKLQKQADKSTAPTLQSLLVSSIPTLKVKPLLPEVNVVQPEPPAVITLEEDVPPPPRRHSKEINYICEGCERSFETEYNFVKHMQWKGFTQEAPEPIFCRQCPKFTYCEKGLKKHFYLSHKEPTNLESLSKDGQIFDTYKCPHCKKKRIYPTLALYRHHLGLCCRRKNCKLCQPSSNKVAPPERKKIERRKVEKEKTKRKEKLKIKISPKAKKNKLAPIECVMVKQEGGDFEEESLATEPFAFISLKCEPAELNCEPVKENAPKVLESQVKEESVGTVETVEGIFECVACEWKGLSTNRLRTHFQEEHSDALDEFQMSVSRCGTVSARWVCPLCGNIFASEEAFLGHVSNHGVAPQDLVAKRCDLRHLPSLMTTLLALKAKKK
ncbi:uncharacterized protein LOC132201373 isoform X2 [Neocloeon triangulifer]|uniref:uncharacterized protein LOC132201373 isoform X2 n=1 Tax=Neocloeon triangulifer TaxID=2078957 RepID=UPI00286EFE47|nr:uncharacterized protein LOC132201373 isoform X2 [Neocloeon triangulifer]